MEWESVILSSVSFTMAFQQLQKRVLVSCYFGGGQFNSDKLSLVQVCCFI